MVERKGFAIRRPAPAVESESPLRIELSERGMVDQTTSSSSTLILWLREVAAMRQAA